MATHDSHGHGRPTDTTDVAATLSRLERLREAIRTVAGVLDATHATHCQPHGDWRPARQGPLEREWTYPHSDARVRLESPGLSQGWTVTLERGDETEAVFDAPVARSRAFDAARRAMRSHADQVGLET